MLSQHTGTGSGFATWSALQAIPNFRKLYLDLLGKATPGTGIWLLKNERFCLWLAPNGEIRILWGSGMPGAGKTVLASIVIQRLEALRQGPDDPICICYIYFRYSDHSKITVRRILEILLKQTFERHADCRPFIEETYAQHLREDTEPTEYQLVTLLRQITNKMTAAFYILDALDEAPSSIQISILRTLTSLNVKIFVTSRPLQVVEAAFPEACTFDIVAQDGDIDLHITKGIDDSAVLLNLLRQEGPSLRDEIFSTVKEKSGGMFLHASLQMDALRGCTSVHQVRQTLQGFPSQIEDVYLQTWNRILEESQESATLIKAVLVWVLNGSRSMTIGELIQAVATSPENYRYDPERVVPEATILALCRGLLVMEEESRLVRLVHYTAQKPLERLLHQSFASPHSFITTVCVELIESGLKTTAIRSKGDFQTRLKNEDLLAYAFEGWAFHARQCMHTEEMKKHITHFVMNSTAFPAFTSADGASLFDFLTPLHIVGLYHLPLGLIDDFEACDPNIATTIGQQSPLIIGSRVGNDAFVKILLGHPKTQVNLVKNDGRSALMVAAEYGHELVAAHLLVHPKIQPNLGNNGGSSALILAAKNGHERVVMLLLARPDIKPNMRNSDGSSALILAARHGYERIITMLLAHREIQPNLCNGDGSSALILSAKHGHERVVTLLLAHPETQLNLSQRNGLSALMVAAGDGHESIVTLLIARPDIQVNAVDKEGWSALMLACRFGHERIAMSLLAHPDIHVNLTRKDGWSALMSACRNGCEGVVTALLARSELQINLVNNSGWSALMLACYSGHEGTVKTLLSVEDIDVNFTSQTGETALKMATQRGHQSIVQTLLQHPGIDPSVEPIDSGRTTTPAPFSRGPGRIARVLEDLASLNNPARPYRPTVRKLSFESVEGSDSDSSASFHDAEDGGESGRSSPSTPD